MFIRILIVTLLMVGASSAQTPTADEELALAAMEGLMAQSPERALPIIKKVLAGPQTKLVKQRALFVLSQLDSPEAQQILAQTARSTDAAMRGEAIRSIGIGGDPKSLEALRQIYDAGGADVKQEVMQAWLIAERKDLVYQVALNAKTEEEASEAIRILGAMGATDELRKLGERPNASKGLLDAYAISGDLASLRKIAESSGEKSLRIEAVSRIGIIDSDAARTALREIYARSTDAEIKDAALHGMLIAQDEQGVLALYRAAKTSEEKRALLRMLSTMDGDAALEAIDAALETKSPAAAPATAPAATTLLEKKFQRAAKQYEKYQHEGQTVYCKKEKTTMSNIPVTQCLTESQLRQQVENYERSRNAAPRGGPPYVSTVPGGN
ncbi:MAG TPA: HEAT repeat domain-containing protein [Steroidobacteraceae bacterium]|nr:HEAT repeat domain-containing protein [Steroidobacteraceae bacterium]